MYYLLFFTLLQRFGSIVFFGKQAEKCVEQIRRDKEKNFSVSSVLESKQTVNINEIRIEKYL